MKTFLILFFCLLFSIGCSSNQETEEKTFCVIKMSQSSNYAGFYVTKIGDKTQITTKEDSIRCESVN